jgi:spermidine synthase
MGFTALLLQIVLARELLVSFFGNEMAIGLILVSWLLYTAAGSDIVGRMSPKVSQSAGTLIVLHLAIAIACPLELYLSWIVGGHSLYPGQAVSPGAIILYSALALSPVCLALGGQFAVACGIVQAFGRPRGIGHVYVLEAFGAVLGGLTFLLAIESRHSAASVVILLSAVNLAAAAWLVLAARPRTGTLLKLLVGLCLGGFFAAVTSPQPATHVALSTAARWGGSSVVGSWDTHYGNLTITRDSDKLAFFHDGIPLGTTQDGRAAEEEAYLPLLEHPASQEALVIGGAASGLLREVLAHPLRHIDYAELDPQALAIIRRHLPPDDARAFADPRVTVQLEDAREYVRTTTRHYDVIIVDMPDPATAGLNRLYTQQFFALARDRLNPSGIFATGVSGGEPPAGEDRLIVQASVVKALEAVFAQVVAIPGWRLHLIAAPKVGSLTTDPQVLAGRIAEQGLKPRFANAAFLRDHLDPARRDALMQALQATPDVLPNADERPVTFVRFLRMWLGERSETWRFLLSEQPVTISLLAFLVLALAVLASVWARKPRAGFSGWAVFCAGFVGIGLEVLAILVFQVERGTVFHEIGLLITAYMAGSAFGGAWGRRADNELEALGDLRRVQWSLFGLCVAGVPLLMAIVALPDLAGALLGLLLFAAGFLGGATFPLSVMVYGDMRGSAPLYALGLLGAACGAGLLSLFLIPAAGVPVALFASAAVAAFGVLGVPIVRALMR